MLSYEYCEIFKSNIFIEHLRWLLLILLVDRFHNTRKKNFYKFKEQFWSKNIKELHHSFFSFNFSSIILSYLCYFCYFCCCYVTRKKHFPSKIEEETIFVHFQRIFKPLKKNCRKEPSYYQDPKNASNNKCCRNHWIFISFCIFLNGLWCGNFPVIFAVKLLRQSMLFEVDCLSVKVFPVEFLTLKHPI